jgi:hypothetical protein
MAALEDATPIWAIMLGLLLLLAAAWEGGARVHAWAARRRADPEDTGDVGQVLTSVLGLLALLVAFTFGLALDRYETRRSLVVDEANALGTAYLRTSVLDAPDRLRGLLRAYASERLTYGLETGRRQAEARGRSERLQAAIWAEANAQLRTYRGSATMTLVLSPLNEAFDLASSRAAALAARIPTTVLVVLLLYAAVSAAVLGYAVGGPTRRNRPASLVMFAVLSLAIGLILDLDRPRGGSIRVPQTAMSDALNAMR